MTKLPPAARCGKPTLKTCTGYLSVSTTQRDGIRRWRVIGRGNMPLCADTADRQRALDAARGAFGAVTLAVWDGDKGEFDGLVQTGGAQ